MLNSVQLLFYFVEVYVEGRFRKCKQACLCFYRLLMLCFAFHEILKAYRNNMIFLNFWPLQAWGNFGDNLTFRFCYL